MNRQHSEPLRVTAIEAERRVSRLVLSEVDNLLYDRKATPVVGERTCWRVSVWLGMPTVGPVGEVGTLDVDAQTGEILYTQQLLDEIAERGNALAQSTWWKQLYVTNACRTRCARSRPRRTAPRWTWPTSRSPKPATCALWRRPPPSPSASVGPG